jgi:hypothetical protein
MRRVVKHADTKFFILNIHSLHNYRLISQALSEDLRKHSFKIEDRPAHHRAAARYVRNQKQEILEKKEAAAQALVQKSGEASASGSKVSTSKPNNGAARGTNVAADQVPLLRPTEQQATGNIPDRPDSEIAQSSSKNVNPTQASGRGKRKGWQIRCLVCNTGH